MSGDDGNLLVPERSGQQGKGIVDGLLAHMRDVDQDSIFNHCLN
jgi:hypothetical protein